MNKETLVFKPDTITVKLGDKEHRLVYDLNAFCELEKIYDSVDSIVQMLLGAPDAPELERVTVNGEKVDAALVAVDGVPIIDFIMKAAADRSDMPKTKHADTLNLLWAGLLHDNAVYDEYDEIKGYSISKSKIGSHVTFRNLREINSKIVMAILRDLLPPVDEDNSKNEEAPVVKPLTLASKTEA